MCKGTRLLFSILIFRNRIIGLYNTITKHRRSRKDWPRFDDALLWFNEEEYEYHKCVDPDELMDVIGSMVILKEIHDYHDFGDITRFHDYPLTRLDFKKLFIEWWLRQIHRGRPNFEFKEGYRMFRGVYREIIT